MKAFYLIKKYLKYLAAFTTVFMIINIFGLTGCKTLVLDQDQETIEMLQNVFSKASYYQYDEKGDIYTVYDNGKVRIGYAFYAEGMGEGVPPAEGLEKVAGPILILVGLEDEETIKAIYVISHNETPEVWSILVMKNYFSQFEGLKITDAYFKIGGGKVDAISGASLSSALVLNTVRNAAKEKFIPAEETKTEWQNILMAAIMIPFVLIPVVFLWFTLIRQARNKRTA